MILENPNPYSKASVITIEHISSFCEIKVIPPLGGNRSGIEYVYFNSLSTIQFVNRFSYSPSNINDILVTIIRNQFIFLYVYVYY